MRIGLAALAAALLASAARAQDSQSQSVPPRDAPSRAVGATHNCADYYPDLSRRLSESGDVLIRYDVAADGSLMNIKVAQSSGSARLDAAALQCVTQRWRNTPARRGGVAVASPNHQALIRFTLQPAPALTLAPEAQGGLNLPETPAPRANAPAADSGDHDAAEALIWTLGPLAILGWAVFALRRWVFLGRACPACGAGNRSVLPFAEPGYCSSCGTRFTQPP